MPTIPKPRVPQWLDPEQASVTEDALTQALRQYLAPVIRTVYGDPTDPTTAMQTAMPTPLITLFKDKAAREAATALYRSGMRRAGPILEQAANNFADDYPRIAAHLKPTLPREDVLYRTLEGDTFKPAAAIQGSSDFSAAQALGPQGLPPGLPPRLKLNIYPEGRRAMSTVDPRLDTSYNAQHLIYHEGTHGAQALGNKNFGQLYTLLNKLVGYENNPFEHTANLAGAAGGGQFPQPPWTTAIRETQRIANQYVGSKGEQGELAQQILDILKARADKVGGKR